MRHISVDVALGAKVYLAQVHLGGCSARVTGIFNGCIEVKTADMHRFVDLHHMSAAAINKQFNKATSLYLWKFKDIEQLT